MSLSPAQLAYREQLNAIEAEKLTALNSPNANPDQQNIIALRKMSAAYVKLRAAQIEEQTS
jgi:hypothetical protein